MSSKNLCSCIDSEFMIWYKTFVIFFHLFMVWGKPKTCVKTRKFIKAFESFRRKVKGWMMKGAEQREILNVKGSKF